MFLCGWWHWWGSRVEMGFSCSCLGLNLGTEIGKSSTGAGLSVYLPHGRISTIAPIWALILTCNKKLMLQSWDKFPFVPIQMLYEECGVTSYFRFKLKLWDGLPWCYDSLMVKPKKKTCGFSCRVSSRFKSLFLNLLSQLNCLLLDSIWEICTC